MTYTIENSPFDRFSLYNEREIMDSNLNFFNTITIIGNNMQDGDAVIHNDKTYNFESFVELMDEHCGCPFGGDV